MLTSKETEQVLVETAGEACDRINSFAKEVFSTRGGRIGSGMGAVMEALWGYYMNQLLKGEEGEAKECELAWMYGHEYNDFACITRDKDWDPESKEGELLRIEAKSMIASADESKAHFDQLHSLLGAHDLLLIIVWDWAPVDECRVTPQILRHFIGAARPIALLRDELHISRGGSFVKADKCPDGCDALTCRHIGEPINANDKRERQSGPEALRVSSKVSHAANFGGMVRMLKTNSEDSRKIFRKIRRESDTAHAYISFIHDSFPNEELNQYMASEWKQLADALSLQNIPKSKGDLVELIRKICPNYKDLLREIPKL